ncbi:MAG: hypothetical protein C4293_02420 [Nitrospiraceae bacterium]
MGNRDSMIKLISASIHSGNGGSIKRHGHLDDAAKQRHMESGLSDSEWRIRQLVEDRERIGRDLHDGVLQSLYVVGLALSTCRILIEKSPTQAADRLDQAVLRLDEAIRQVRSLLRTDLGAQLIEGEDLETSLRLLVQTMTNSASVTHQLDIDSEAAASIRKEQHAQVLHIVREALSNSLRHARPKTVGVSLKAGDEGFCLEIWDDGIGFNPRKPSHRGFGLDNLSKRADSLGGRMQIMSRPWQGTRIVIQLPER